MRLCEDFHYNYYIQDIYPAWNHITNPERVVIGFIDPVIGHNLLSTKRNGRLFIFKTSLENNVNSVINT